MSSPGSRILLVPLYLDTLALQVVCFSVVVVDREYRHFYLNKSTILTFAEEPDYAIPSKAKRRLCQVLIHSSATAVFYEICSCVGRPHRNPLVPRMMVDDHYANHLKMQFL
ncbi:uncharacterized protein EV420DRAFT_604716 [Desarmillaria tabescens]|uniref:Uncharacterized protein n=1 Tax=Armillaria tabescens TaxID=1929756 RepID=A0AA39N1X9_ARMTA|nr:uncharacterized protein EV420DRAFT_604716 [Desarmillaria tabescens]KAK0454190.1 hypothetical protein EV420DRAFT_604716 [Desarmillaria tabescens]